VIPEEIHWFETSYGVFVTRVRHYSFIVAIDAYLSALRDTKLMVEDLVVGGMGGQCERQSAPCAKKQHG